MEFPIGTHSRASTTQDIYQQLVPESQRQAVRRLTACVRRSDGSSPGEEAVFSRHLPDST
jgi:hypothetical protein